MRYSELAGKEIIDLSLGVRLGVVSSTDLVIDTEQGTIEAMVIYQRAGFFSSREIEINWSGVRKVGQELIIVEMDETVEATPATTALPWSERRSQISVSSGYSGRAPDSPMAGSVNSHQELERLTDRRKVRRRVAGLDSVQEAVGSEAVVPMLEDSAPELLVDRIPSMVSRSPIPLWRRGGRRRVI